MKLVYNTSTGSKVPVEIKVKRVSRDRMLQHLTTDKDKRNNWCTHDKPCGKFGKRPCCPPQVKTFDELAPKKYMYLVMVKIVLDEYYEVYPNVRESKSWLYFGMDGTHKMSRNIQNKLSTHFDGQAFRVGGCLGCQWTKQGKCKRFAPALEATGINVVWVAKDVFGETIHWRPDGSKEQMPHMISIGGIYTDEDIPMSKFKEVMEEICGLD